MNNKGSITKYCLENIKQSADTNFKHIAESHYGTMKAKGSQRVVDCPHCGKEQALEFNFSKGNFKCFKCGEVKGKGALAWATNALNMEFIEAITFLAEKTNINIEYETKTLSNKIKTGAKAVVKAVSNLINFKSFRDITLEQSGLTVEDVTSKVKTDDNTTVSVVRYTSGSKQGNTIVDGDDIILHYVTLYRTYDQEFPKKTNGEISGKPFNFSRVRYQRPEDHPDKNGKPIKYASPYKSGLHIWHPEPLIRKFETKAEIPTLWIQEGEKKADKCTKHGVISCGIMGINNLVGAEGLHPDFGLIITQCQTKSVVFTVDSDWQTLKSSDPNQSIDGRARSFLSAVRKFQQYFIGFTNQNIHLKIYFSYVKPNESDDKGTDDLLTKTLAGKEDELLADYQYAMASGNGKGKYVDCIDITAFSEHQLKELFHLESKESFVDFHKEALAGREDFKFSGTKWKFAEDGSIELAQPMSPDHIFWKAKHGKSSSEERYDFLPDRWLQWCKERCNIGRFLTGKDATSYLIIKADSITKTIAVIKEFQAIDYMMDFIYSIGEMGIFNWLFNSDKYFNTKKIHKLWFLNDIIHLLKNEKTVGYMFFNHGFWKVTNAEIKHYDINDAPGYIWEEKVKDAQPKLDTEQLFTIHKSAETGYTIKFRKDWEKAHYLKFLFNTSIFCGHGNTPNQAELEEAYKNLMTKITAYGYLMHHYYDPANTKMIVAMDGKEREIGDADGRSGKSQYFKGIENTVTLISIDGRQPNLLDDKFLFSKVTERTSVVYIDDIDRKIPIEPFFVKISGGFEARSMYQETRTIAQEFTPKLAASTNYGLRGVLDSGSSIDRLCFIVFSDYYNKDHKPMDDFGIRFFDDWEGEQWTYFYNFAALCLHYYLKFGLLDFANKRQDRIHLATDIGSTFMDWANEYIRDSGRFATAMERPAMMEDYRKQNPKYPLTSQAFRKKCLSYAKLNERVLISKKTEGKEYYQFSNTADATIDTGIPPAPGTITEFADGNNAKPGDDDDIPF